MIAGEWSVCNLACWVGPTQKNLARCFLQTHGDEHGAVSSERGVYFFQNGGFVKNMIAVVALAVLLGFQHETFPALVGLPHSSRCPQFLCFRSRVWPQVGTMMTMINQTRVKAVHVHAEFSWRLPQTRAICRLLCSGNVSHRETGGFALFLS